jgi:hypothetical protein
MDTKNPHTVGAGASDAILGESTEVSSGPAAMTPAAIQQEAITLQCVLYLIRAQSDAIVDGMSPLSSSDDVTRRQFGNIDSFTSVILEQIEKALQICEAIEVGASQLGRNA